MNKLYRTKHSFFVFAILLILAGVALAWRGITEAQEGTAGLSVVTAPVDTSFTFQGYLDDNGSPANGKYDFRFSLFDEEMNGTPVGGRHEDVDDVAVSAGLFTALLDFGPVFDGTALWLEIGVRPSNLPGPYTTLSPRQAITATPYAHSLRPGAVISGAVSSGPSGRSVLAVTNEATTGATYGLRGESASVSGSGVYGASTASSGATSGGYFVSLSPQGAGVFAEAIEGPAGVFGRANTNNAAGVYGEGLKYGVEGYAEDPEGGGVAGGFFQALSGKAYGVHGYIPIGIAGVFGETLSDRSWGIRAQGPNVAAYIDGNMEVTGFCTGCLLAVYGRNVGDTELGPGDVVAIKGTSDSEFSGIPILLDVGLAGDGDTVVGVVQGNARVIDDVLEETAERLLPGKAAAAPSDYVTIIIYGPVQVKSSQFAGSFSAGTRLAAATGGRVRGLQTTFVDDITVAESVPTLGIALEDSASDGLVWVLVNPK